MSLHVPFEYHPFMSLYDFEELVGKSSRRHDSQNPVASLFPKRTLKFIIFNSTSCKKHIIHMFREIDLGRDKEH